ncbi:MAG: lysoplasmalogenase [Ilumatobacteraceae bacterium]
MQAAVVVASIVAAAAAIANWWSRWRDDSRVELVSKPLATIAIAVLGVVVADDVSTGAIVAAVVGFACCLAGDVALLPAIDRFVTGLVCFLAGHLAFVVMFVLLGLDRWWVGLVALAGVACVALLAGRRIVAGAREQDPGLAVPVQVYLAIICAMAVIGWSTGRTAAMAGSALFVASDAMLGWRQFVRSRPWMPVAVMVTYHGALTGLALSLA